MEGSEISQGNFLQKESKHIVWQEVQPIHGPRTERLFNTDARIKYLKHLRILEHVVPNSDTGIVMFPGALDMGTDDQALQTGAERRMSVFHIKYPADSSFSIRREVAELLDHTQARGIKKYHIIAGSWGGIPALNAIYQLLSEGSADVESLLLVSAALQPSDLATVAKTASRILGRPLLKTRLPLPRRPVVARLSPRDALYGNQEVLDKIGKIPTVILVPPGGHDWLVDGRRSYGKYLPGALRIEYPAYNSKLQKIKTLGGHDARGAIDGIRQIQKDLLDNPKIQPAVPLGFKKILKYRSI